ncbi:MAG: RagB/SusD family nutrient uptake outer membrane protein, partial [Cytophagales bacterium]|nr:RagB/SusD family nutrient uptake outer membrane protein [Cytophagales bacterium]
MKNICYIFSLLGIIVLCSCQDDFLNKSPNDQLSTVSFWKTEADANAGLVAVYDALDYGTSSIDSRMNFGWATLGYFDVLTPIAHASSSRPRRIAEGTHDPSLTKILDFWSYLYRGVVRANDFLTHIEDIPFTGDDAADKKNRMIGEARMLRAMFYYMLAEQFGDVPLFTTVPTVEDASTKRAPKREVLELIKEDIAFAIANLPPRGGEETGRATRGAALALKVKVALYEKDWETAANAAKEIIDSDKYSLVPDFANVININNENNEEIIFGVEHIYNDPTERGGIMGKLYGSRSAEADGWAMSGPTL